MSRRDSGAGLARPRIVWGVLRDIGPFWHGPVCLRYAGRFDPDTGPSTPRPTTGTTTAPIRGGEEFVVLLPETDAYGGAIVAERLGAAVRDSAHAEGPIRRR